MSQKSKELYDSYDARPEDPRVAVKTNFEIVPHEETLKARIA